MPDDAQGGRRFAVSQRIRILPGSPNRRVKAGAAGVVTGTTRNPFTGEVMYQVQLDDGTRALGGAGDLETTGDVEQS